MPLVHPDCPRDSVRECSAPFKISKIAEEGVAGARLKPIRVAHVLTDPVSNSGGRDALRITIVIEPDAAKQLAERAAAGAVLDILVEIQDRLLEAGEKRLSIVEYATAEELESGDDP